MLGNLFARFFGNRHERESRRVQPIVDAINHEYERLHGVSEEELRAQTAKFRAILHERTGAMAAREAELREQKRTTGDAAARDQVDHLLHGPDGRGGVSQELRTATAEVLDEILPEAFATVREACRRLVGTTVVVTGHPLEWNMVPYDVQLMGGIQLHLGRIAEMATGEGKTLVATLPLYLNALPGRGAHLVTVNSYLAGRDSQWMGHIYTYLGLTVGCIDETMPGTAERRGAYLCDITYGTNNEFGFDYLRDNMVASLEQRVQREHVFAIVDEVDSVLIDEARTPLIISGPVGNAIDTLYADHNTAVARLVRRQSDLVNQLVADGERALEQGDSEDGAIKLYQAQLGSPKNKRLLKALQESGVKQAVQQAELKHIADRKLPPGQQQLAQVEDDLMFVLDERGHSVHLTDRGIDYLSPGDHQAFILPDFAGDIHRIERDSTMSPEEKLATRSEVEREYAAKSEMLNVVHQLLRAHVLYERDVNYVVQDGQVLIVDEFTGRALPGRRWSEGLHQAVEAKEAVQVKEETQTLATITIQNYFRMFDKLAGMTGTAETEEAEFHQIYGLEVAVIPTNMPIVREDRHDLVFRTRREKYNAIVEETRRLHDLGFPVLVGTVTVDVSETVSRMFKRAGLEHNVLNAKYHQREAEIVAGAGQPGAVTIATNMAGRGTDIKLGPGVTPSKPSVIKDLDGKDIETMEAGGLHIIGSERHESRRIDRQLRGRAGRQGDPGASQFFLSLEDDLMRLFGSERIAKIMDRLGAKEGEVLTHPLITRSIETAQKRIEEQNFQTRKRLLEFDDVMNQQREVIYSLRSFALQGGGELKGEAEGMVERAVTRRVEMALSIYDDAADWDLALLRQDLLMHYLLTVPELESPDLHPTTLQDARAVAMAAGQHAFDQKMQSLGEPADRVLSWVLLNVLDEKWKDHLYDLDQLRAAIYYRSWGQKDPLIEYKQEAYTMFEDLMHDIANTFGERFLRVQLMPLAPPVPPPVVSEPPRPKRRFNALGIAEDVAAQEATASAVGSAVAEPPAQGDGAPQPQAPRTEAVVIGAGRPRPVQPAPVASPDWSTVGRNDPCPCGSGKKFKKCHGATP